MNENKTNINWYPGHMAKTMKQIEQDLNLVDIIIEILDARIPKSSQNPEVEKIIKNKKKIIVLNKSDLAEDSENIKWINYFEKNNIPAILCNANNGEGINKLENIINKLMTKEKEKALEKGRIGRATRAMVIGVPNVGKSSFINRIAKRNRAEVGNKPGVTKQKQWIKLSNNIELLDTPGVLWPKFDTEETALKISYTGTIKNEILQETEIAYSLIKYMLQYYQQNLVEKYKLNEKELENNMKNEELEPNERIVKVIEMIGASRNVIAKGGNIDLDKTSKIILDDFKNGRLGKISLEKVEE